MTTALQRVLEYPHSAVFDKDPGAELALRLRHPDGAAWRVADEALEVTVGELSWTYDLAQHSIGSLAMALEADGFEVSALASRFAHIGASALIEGSGDQGRSNGDHLRIYTSLLWALLGGYAREVREGEYQVQEALRQMVITQAEGEWLDLWGTLYSVGRPEGDTDAQYQPKIPEEAFRVRVNGFAIEKAIKEITGKTVEIREPWRQMFTLSESALSGSDRFPDPSYYGYFLIHPVAREHMDWADVMEVIHRNRAAGIEVYQPAVELPIKHVEVQPPVEYLADAVRHDVYTMGSWAAGEAPLGIMRLSDNEFTFNHPMMVYEVRTFGNVEGVQTEQTFGRPANIAVAAMVLSDGVPFGDENAVLSRGLITYFPDPQETLSDQLVPSDYVNGARHERVERITIDQHAYGLTFPEPEVGSRLSHYRPMSFYAARITNDGWTGNWDDRQWFGEHMRMGMNLIHIPAGDVMDDNLLLDVSIIT